MRVTLSTAVPVERFAVLAELAWLERRPELGLLCRAAREGDGRISPATVHAVLPGLLDAGANNVIRWCQAVGLCDPAGSLTALGEDVADTDEAPVPVQGVYGFLLAQHPVLGRRLLAVERLASRPDQRFELIEPLTVEPDRGVVFRSVLSPRDRFVLRDLPTNHGQVGVLRQPTQATCRLRWTLDFEAERDEWQLDGRIDASQGARPMQHEPEHEGLDLWALAAAWGAGPLASVGRWEPDARRLAVSVEGLEVAAQDGFVMTVKLRHVEVPGKGGYDDVTLEDVPIGPATAADAQRWAMARLARRLEHTPKYRSRRDLRHLFIELCEATPLEPYAPRLPTHERYIGDDLHATQPEVFWNLAAPVDLAPHPPTLAELGELRIGAPTGDDR